MQPSLTWSSYINQADHKLTGIYLSLPLEYRNSSCMSPCPALCKFLDKQKISQNVRSSGTGRGGEGGSRKAVKIPNTLLFPFFFCMSIYVHMGSV